MDAHNRGVEAQNGALGGLKTRGRFDEEQDPDPQYRVRTIN